MGGCYPVKRDDRIRPAICATFRPSDCLWCRYVPAEGALYAGRRLGRQEQAFEWAERSSDDADFVRWQMWLGSA